MLVFMAGRPGSCLRPGGAGITLIIFVSVDVHDICWPWCRGAVLRLGLLRLSILAEDQHFPAFVCAIKSSTIFYV
jgi:hypothetical protein